VGKGPLYFWIYVFYLSKYYEWADTALMCLKKVPLSLSSTRRVPLNCRPGRQVHPLEL
jgi:hypothetical protein